VTPFPIDWLFDKKARLTRGNVPDDKSGNYWVLNLRALITGGNLSFPLFLKTVEAGSNKVKYLRCCEVEEIFPEDWKESLRQMGVNRLYFHKDDYEKVIDYLNNHLTLLESQGETSTRQKLEVLHDHLNLTLQQAFNSHLSGSGIQIAILQSDRMLKELEKDPVPLQSLWDLLILDYSHYNHAINVFLLATSFMCYLRQKRSETRNLGISALFKDVGMIKIPEKILYNPNQLNQGDFHLIQQHPRESFTILQTYPIIPPEAMHLILEHHENADGSGYPQSLDLMQQHPNSRIVRMADSYVAMISPRPYRAAYNSFKALKILQEQQGPAGPVFDQDLLVKFIKFLAHCNYLLIQSA
jgi:HD-GYP domain-containing protein (c-di-GMP phosphodiesterase class II)